MSKKRSTFEPHAVGRPLANKQALIPERRRRSQGREIRWDAFCLVDRERRKVLGHNGAVEPRRHKPHRTMARVDLADEPLAARTRNCLLVPILWPGMTPRSMTPSPFVRTVTCR